jgi:biotin carboxyl carrier protein
MPTDRDLPATVLVIDDTAYQTTATRKFAERRRWVAPDPRAVVAHIPGVVCTVYVKVGESIRRGDRLLVLEAMKMQNDVSAPCTGRVKAVHVIGGQMVAKGERLVELE